MLAILIQIINYIWGGIVSIINNPIRSVMYFIIGIVGGLLTQILLDALHNRYHHHTQIMHIKNKARSD